ncbi:Gfo/Idh/MocA family protein [Tropicimonas isoalkanivorans]|uniref:Predicted dehydrogenase n=1 Tax=Tropicimonas isoalkanivorans TaxID=441112 RepID=A0A1I1HA50_9RHOB|nr:Gfo/Idh/MocA family oxidoreductase [Tropicimonas isoalkanivorans]SFC20731.1 Predicted dehydrogenase [Tropicimonas isoalkanivorans]
MAHPTRLAVAGTGLIGLRHVEAILKADGVELAGVMEPNPEVRAHAEALGAKGYASLDELLSEGGADGVIVAVPNQLHEQVAGTCIDAGLPVLVEKPLTDDVAAGERLLARAGEAGVAVLTGHHRRHNPLIRKALEIVRSGELGALSTVQAQTWFLKPDDYFDAEWRRKKGAGPVYLNLIHDIDLLQALCGPVARVHAMESNAVRGNEVEETAVVLLRFASGLLGTVNVSDAAAAPWSWELTARENAHYPATAENCYWIGGTRGSLALPNLAVWHHTDDRGWWGPIGFTKPIFSFEDPLVLQAAHFGAVIRGEEAPIVSGADGLSALKVIEAVKLSAATGSSVDLDDVSRDGV